MEISLSHKWYYWSLNTALKQISTKYSQHKQIARNECNATSTLVKTVLEQWYPRCTLCGTLKFANRSFNMYICTTSRGNDVRYKLDTQKYSRSRQIYNISRTLENSSTHSAQRVSSILKFISTSFSENDVFITVLKYVPSRYLYRIHKWVILDHTLHRIFEISLIR